MRTHFNLALSTSIVLFFSWDFLCQCGKSAKRLIKKGKSLNLFLAKHPTFSSFEGYTVSFSNIAPYLIALHKFHHVAQSMRGGGPRVVVSTAAFHARVRGSVPGLGGLKETKMFLPHPRVKVSIVGSLRDREVACSASDRQGSNFESCVWRTVSSQSSHHPQEVLLAQFSLYVHKGGLKPDSFHFYLQSMRLSSYAKNGLTILKQGCFCVQVLQI